MRDGLRHVGTVHTGKHTLKLYGSLDSDQAAVLVQARTNHTHLNSNLARL
jgi:hypothetical protein